MMRTVLGLLLLGGVLMGLITEETLAAETTPAPVWPAGGTHFIPKSYKQPPLDDPDHALWRQARLLGPLCANGQPEAPDSRSDVRLLFHDGTLWVRARCLDPAPAKIGHGDDPEEIWQGDSIEMLFSECEDAAFPLLHVQVSAGGLLRVVRYLRPFAPWGDPLLENPDPSQIKVRAKVDKRGWWVILGIPVEFYRIGQPTFQANVTRNRLGKPTGHAWVDLFNGRFQRPSRLGHMTMTEDPPKTRPALALPGGLAVGVNRLKVSNAGPGTVLRFGDKTLPVSREGTVSVEVSRHGHIEMALVAGKGQSDLRYGAEVRRPLIVDAVKPFQEDAKAPIDVKIALCTASEAPVVVTLEGFAGKERVARKTLKLTNGTHDVQLTHTLEAPGEVRLVVRAEVPTGGKPLAVEAYHWCVLGKPAEAFDHFRKGIDDLPTRSLLRAGLADAVTYFRLIQTGEGIYANRPGSKRAREWNRCFVYVPALLYKADWPENPHRGDKRLLDSARLGLEREVDPALWQHFMTFPPNRDLQPALLAYGLIKDDVPPEQAAYLRRSLERIVEAVVETWITPAEDLYTFYSRDVGTGTNHWAYHVANVYTAGKVLDRPEWVALGQKMMLRLAKHEQDGQFPERRGTPASTYTWLTINALGEYYRQSGDESVKETLMRCARWGVHMLLPDGTMIRLHDGRVNWHGGTSCGHHVLWLTPEGRYAARRDIARRINSSRKPSRSGGMESWFRRAETAVYFQPGEEKPLPTDTEYPFLDGRGIVVRRKGHTYALSAICLPPIQGLFQIDPQNAVEWYHAKAGMVLKGHNSQGQPEAGSFHRKIAGRAVYLPTSGKIQRTAQGHVARLKFNGFETQVIAEVVDGSTGRVKVELLEATGDEPVIFSFFPGVREPEESSVSKDGKTITFRNVTLTTSESVQVQRDLKLYNPYRGNYTVGSKPVRAFVTLRKHRPFVITIRINDKP